MSHRAPAFVAFFAVAAVAAPAQEPAQQPAPPEGFVALFNGADTAGWHGMGHFDPRKLWAMSDGDRAKMRARDGESVAEHWSVENGELVNDGQGAYLTTDRDYRDIELRLEYKTVAKADSGIYLRGTPQVQIWDTTEAGGKWNLGADKGSGGLWNNQKHARFPLVLADKPFGEWNDLRIVQIGERTSVWFNGHLIVDWVVMENFWDRARPLFATGPIQLQTHGGEIRFRNVFLREIGTPEANELLAARFEAGFQPLCNGKDLTGWQGATDSYAVDDGAIVCKAGKGGTLFTEATFGDFVARLEFRLPPGGNNGLAVRYPGTGDAAYAGMELQVLDDSAEKYATLKPWQYHGSVYGLVAAQRGYLRPVGEWNFQEVRMEGSRVTVTCNGTTIVAADVAAIEDPTSGREHPGRLRTEGHFGFCGHGDPVAFRNVRIKRL